MLTFIISMRARALARNWAYHTWLLERTLDSILAQTSPEFNVVVACHDVPEVPHANHPSVHMLPMDFQLPERNNDDMCVDKVLKISRGAEWAIARGSNYVMFVDADDLVSRRLSEFVATHPHENGWYFYTGYAHRYGERWVRKHVPHHLICGTGVIVSTSLLRFAASDFCRGHIANTLAEAGMENYLTHLDVQGAPIRPLPFPGAIYVLHDDSTSEVPGGIGYRLNSPHSARPLWRRVGSWGKHTTRALRHVRPISPWLRAEYRIPREDFEQYR